MEDMEPKIDIEPDAWASKIMCAGPQYGKTIYDKLPIQSLNPLYYAHEKLYSEKSVIALTEAKEDENAKLRSLLELLFSSTHPYNDGEPTFSDAVTDLWKELTPND